MSQDPPPPGVCERYAAGVPPSADCLSDVDRNMAEESSEQGLPGLARGDDYLGAYRTLDDQVAETG